MMYSHRVALLFSAFSVAMQAKTGDLDPIDVEDILTRAQQFLEVEDFARIAITTFATHFELNRYDRARMVELGDDLLRDIDIASVPAPPDAERRDIHG